ncbi:2-(1,2-epoxy-1,2-dihydrophenyl)acetyl-CoA isomerase [Escherichia coli]|nr:2-(1,2-epoxy-1,2-dihydrophenyl)acetyl-CoA isomerase [Escherichia coli]
MMEFILSHVEKGVMTLTLNRPERLNSFNDEMHAQLAECLKQVERDDTIRCLLLTGAGRGFCAGQDLNDRNVDPTGPAPDLGMSVERFYNPLVRRLAKLPKPVICAVNGVAAGAGATLALGCDIVIAARSAKFVMAFSKLGLVPDCGGTWLLPRVAGRARAMGLALLGNQLSAEQAHEWGMIWQVVDDETLADTAQQLARHLATQPTFGLGLIKQAINSAETNTLDTQLDLEREAVVGLEAVSDSFSPMKVEKKSDGVTEIDDVLLIETQGETAQALAIRLARPVVVVDKMAGKVVTIAAAAVNPDSATRKAIYYLQQQGKTVLQIADYPGMLIWRTVAMIINEALDALQKGVASEQDIDTAMRLGVNYPYGPLAWGAQLGWQRILRLLENLQHHYGEERYRPCSLLRQRALLESGYES